ncbi:hypothetical protein BDZ91DRAFT_759412 [Kalaharituber pfeilii]|nr:hypothetical protein BDZ91DRAFT_759412 [Kalaharituber pfeilii]
MATGPPPPHCSVHFELLASLRMAPQVVQRYCPLRSQKVHLYSVRPAGGACPTPVVLYLINSFHSVTPSTVNCLQPVITTNFFPPSSIERNSSNTMSSWGTQSKSGEGSGSQYYNQQDEGAPLDSRVAMVPTSPVALKEVLIRNGVLLLFHRNLLVILLVLRVYDVRSRCKGSNKLW